MIQPTNTQVSITIPGSTLIHFHSFQLPTLNSVVTLRSRFAIVWYDLFLVLPLYIPQVSEIDWHLSSLWFSLLNMMDHSSIYVSISCMISPFLVAIYHSVVHIYNDFFIPSFAIRYLSCIHILASVLNIAISIGIYMYFMYLYF